jgi:hypothetical protein
LWPQVAANYHDVIIKAQGHPETIEPGAQIRSARRNANGNLLHSETECSDASLQRQPIHCATPIRKYADSYG